jgi:predicted RNA-binding Zn-ribbon protein involved in translation (DUF1610 family)
MKDPTLWTHTCACGATVNAAEPPKEELKYSCPGCGQVVTVTPPAKKEK